MGLPPAPVDEVQRSAMGAWRVLMVCVGVGLPTFGCGNLPVAPPADTVQSRAGSAQFGGTQFDGVYQGAIQITSAAQGIPRDWCQPVGDRMILRVANDFINYTLTYSSITQTLTFSVPIASDGSFSGTGSMNATMEGQVTGNQISGTMAGEGCAWAFSVQRS